MVRFEEWFGRSHNEKTFDEDFFDFSDPLHPWTTVYRFMLFFDLKHGIQAMAGFGQQGGEGHRINGLEADFHMEGSKLKTPLSYWTYKDTMNHETYYSTIDVSHEALISDDFTFKKEGEAYHLTLDKAGMDVVMKGEMDITYQHYDMGYVPFGRHNCYAPYKGTLAGHESEGFAFIQKVNHNMPFIPWRWGRAFFEDGTRFVFFEPRPGIKLFKHLSMVYGGEKYNFNKGTRIDIEKENDDTLPRWELSGETKNGEALRVLGEGIARAENRFESKRSYFSYNEYPSKILEMEFNGPDGKIYADDVGRTSFNTEDAYYVKII